MVIKLTLTSGSTWLVPLFGSLLMLLMLLVLVIVLLLVLLLVALLLLGLCL